MAIVGFRWWLTHSSTTQPSESLGIEASFAVMPSLILISVGPEDNRYDAFPIARACSVKFHTWTNSHNTRACLQTIGNAHHSLVAEPQLR